MTFQYVIEMAVAHGWRVEQIGLRRVLFRSLNGYYRLEFILGRYGWEGA